MGKHCGNRESGRLYELFIQKSEVSKVGANMGCRSKSHVEADVKLWKKSLREFPIQECEKLPELLNSSQSQSSKVRRHEAPDPSLRGCDTPEICENRTSKISEILKSRVPSTLE
jgi:hypothetical protein